MTAAAVRRMLDALFRRWPFYLAMVLGFLGLGVVNVLATSDEYTSTGSLFVDSQSLVSAQSGVRESGIFSFLSPAQFTSQELSGLISTDVFMEAAMERAGVDLAASLTIRAGQVEELRQAVGSFSSSENLVAVSVTTPDPELSFRMAEGVIAEFVQFQINLDVAESNASEAFFADLVEEYREELVAARAEVESALRGVADLDQLSPERQLEVQRLQAAESLAEDRFLGAAANVEASRLATLQAATDVQQSYSLFDPPTLPTEPNGSLFAQVMLVAIFLAIGLFLALIGPIVAALLNRAIIFPDDLDLGDGLGVVAVLPKAGRRELSLAGSTVSPDWGDGKGSAEGLGQRTITFLPTEDDSDDDALTAITAQAATVQPVQPPAPPADEAAPSPTPSEEAASTPAAAAAEPPATAASPAPSEASSAAVAQPSVPPDEPPAVVEPPAPSEERPAVVAEPSASPAAPPPAPPGHGGPTGPPPPPLPIPAAAPGRDTPVPMAVEAATTAVVETGSKPEPPADETLIDAAPQPFTIASKPDPEPPAFEPPAPVPEPGNGSSDASDDTPVEDLLATREIGDLPPALGDSGDPAKAAPTGRDA